MAKVCASFVEEVFTKAVNDNGKKVIISFAGSADKFGSSGTGHNSV